MNNNYSKGILWFILSLVISNLNDIAAKFLILKLDPLQITSLRFFWSIISLLPCIIYYGTKCLKTSNIKIHIARGSIFYIAISMWIWGVGEVPLATVTTISFTVPIFVLILAPKFLNEKVSKSLWLSTLVCLIGTILALGPVNQGFKPLSILLIISSLLFAILDIINKKYIIEETTISMLFYSAIVSFICSIPGAIANWNPITLKEVIGLALLGAGSNAILYCILTAFKYISASALSPYRYLELILSLALGYLYFNEIPTLSGATGSLIIVASTLYVNHQQSKSNY